LNCRIKTHDTSRTAISEVGVAHLRNSMKDRPAEKARRTPTGLPTTVMLLPMFVAKTDARIMG